MADHPAMIQFSTVRELGERRLLVNVLAGEGAANVGAGYGGWEVINRPGREGLVNWVGYEPLRVTVPILFDAVDVPQDQSPGEQIEEQISRLEAMAGRGRRRLGGEPPVIYVDAPGSLIPFQMAGSDDPSPTRFVIENIDWGDALRNRYGNRIRQAAEVTLLHHVTATGLERSAAKRSKAGKKGLPTTYTVKKTDTLKRIAKFFYNDPDNWKDIWRANKKKIRDPRAKLKPGLKLRIPALKKKK
jgi:nucleoid-associated protein YgaU